MKVIESKYFNGLHFERIEDTLSDEIYGLRVFQNKFGASYVYMRCFKIQWEEDMIGIYHSYITIIQNHLNDLKLYLSDTD
jgi:hypothetical protein